MSKADIAILIHEIAHQNSVVAYRQFYDIHYKLVFSFTKSIVPSLEDCEEIVNDVFIKIWNNRKALSDIQNLNSYIYVLTKNTSLNWLKANKKIKRIYLNEVELEIVDLQLSPEMKYISKENIAVINDAISKLPAQCKQVFKFAKDDGLKHKEIAELLRITVKTVEYHMGMALKRISENLQMSLDKK